MKSLFPIFFFFLFAVMACFVLSFPAWGDYDTTYYKYLIALFFIGFVGLAGVLSSVVIASLYKTVAFRKLIFAMGYPILFGYTIWLIYFLVKFCR